jgi:hypothetical protein
MYADDVGPTWWPLRPHVTPTARQPPTTRPLHPKASRPPGSHLNTSRPPGLPTQPAENRTSRRLAMRSTVGQDRTTTGQPAPGSRPAANAGARLPDCPTPTGRLRFASMAPLGVWCGVVWCGRALGRTSRSGQADRVRPAASESSVSKEPHGANHHRAHDQRHHNHHCPEPGDDPASGRAHALAVRLDVAADLGYRHLAVERLQLLAVPADLRTQRRPDRAAPAGGGGPNHRVRQRQRGPRGRHPGR